MECPRCRKPNPEEQRYCGSCGTPLVPALTYLETVIKARVDEVIASRFKEQRLIELETTEAIASRLWGRAKLVGGILALIGLGLSIAGIRTYTDFSSRVEQAVKSVTKASEDAVRSAVGARARAEEAQRTIQEATQRLSKMLGEASQISSELEALTQRISEMERQTTIKINDASNRVSARVSDLSKKLDSATREIMAQQEKLASTDQLVTALFSQGKVVSFDTKTESERFVILERKDGATVYMLLDHAPIPQTLELQYHIYVQPKGSYLIGRNVVIFNWGQSLSSLEQHPLVVSYVPDPTIKEPLFRSLAAKNGRVYADGQQLPEISTKR